LWRGHISEAGDGLLIAEMRLWSEAMSACEEERKGMDTWYGNHASVSETFSIGSPDPDAVTPVVMEGRANVPPFYPMGGPRFSDVWLFVDKDLCVCGCKWCTIVVECSIELSMCR
jgi:hypothetical protein